MVLVAPTLDDEQEFVAAMRASRALHHPWVSFPSNGEAFREYLARCAQDSFAGRIVRRRSDGAIVGVVNLSEIVRGRLQSAFLGYGAVREHAGQGYMSDGLRLVLREAFEVMRLHRVEANIQPANVASIRLVERCGFQYEGLSPRYLKIGGRWRDHQRWAMRVELWRALGQA